MAEETAAAKDLSSVTGNWQNIPDGNAETGSGLIAVTIDANNTMSAKVIKVGYNDPNPKCVKCTGELKDAPIIGLSILNKLPYIGNNTWQGGEILDPESGKFYKVKIVLEENGTKLKVRGYIGAPAFGRTQYWLKQK